MIHQLYTVNGSAIWFAAGFPDNYAGKRLQGSNPWYCRDSWGEIIIQEIRRLHYTLQYRVFNATTRQQVTTISTDGGLTTTSVLKDICRQTITGSGKLFLREEQFASLFARSFSRGIDIREGATMIMLDTTWNERYLQEFIADNKVLQDLVRGSGNRVPLVMGEPYRPFSPAISSIINNLMWSPYDEELTEAYREELLVQYLSEILKLSVDMNALTSHYKRGDVDKVMAARDLIMNNPSDHIHIRDIAKQVHMNECTLKMRFRQLIGKSMFEYLLYKRCIKVRDAIIHSDLPIKAFYKDAGYSSLANFLHGFKKQIGCYPSELRK